MLGKLKPFLAPYSFQLFVSVFMIVISIAAITAAPRIEGMITSRLAADVASSRSIWVSVSGAAPFSLPLLILRILRSQAPMRRPSSEM